MGFVRENQKKQPVSWFSGGDERRKEALKLIRQLLQDEPLNSPSLVSSLQAYERELETKTSSVPFVLSCLNVEVAKLIYQEAIPLSQSQEETLKSLRQLANIRYGY